MPPLGTLSQPLILLALGLIAVILSFVVPDRKKSLISLGLAGLIVLAGVIQFASQSFSRYQWNRRIRQIQQEQRVNLDELRERMKNRQGEASASGLK